MSRRVLISMCAENDIAQLGFDQVQQAHSMEVAARLQDFDNPEEIEDLEIKQLNHFYEVRQLFDMGGPLRSRKLQLRFGVVEKNNGDVVILQVTDNHDNPDTIEMITLEDRYQTYLKSEVARVLVDSTI